MASKIANNVVSRATIRKIQSKTLHELSDVLARSFGPNGSNACIKKENALSRYTKDGHTIIGAIHYNGIIEQSIKDDIESITRHIVKTVGDGTTSAVILSSLIFDAFVKLEEEGFNPSQIIRSFDKVVSEISSIIEKSAHEIDNVDVYDIAMISTNGNTFVAETLDKIYREFGHGVFIDVTPSTGSEFVIKSYNGMTLNTGFANACYVTNKENNSCEVPNPEVYFFEHPIDTREMGVFLDAILSRNIIKPCNEQNFDALIPTVIFAPTLSQDMSAYMDSLVNMLAQMPANNKLPICFIIGSREEDRLTDMAQMCGAKMIRKYIDPKIYMNDVENGFAPTPETIFNWAGHCDRVTAYSEKTTIVRPHDMYEADGVSHSEKFKNLVDFLENEIKINTADGGDIAKVGALKRRLNSLKSNMVELFVGGITQADRDSVRDLVEDAVLNIRSAAQYGVGLGANMSAANAIADWMRDIHECGLTDLEYKILSAIENAYCLLIGRLYEDTKVATYDDPVALANMLIDTYRDNGTIYNIREEAFVDNVKTSIKSDITVLETVSKIIGIMATCNQFIVPTAMHNIYEVD